MIVVPPPTSPDHNKIVSSKEALMHSVVLLKTYHYIFKLLLLCNCRSRQCAGKSLGHTGCCRPKSLQCFPPLFNLSVDACYATVFGTHHLAFAAGRTLRHFIVYCIFKWLEGQSCSVYQGISAGICSIFRTAMLELQPASLCLQNALNVGFISRWLWFYPRWID